MLRCGPASTAMVDSNHCIRHDDRMQQRRLSESAAHLAAQLGAFADAARVVAQQRAAVARLLVHRRARLDLRSAAASA